MDLENAVIVDVEATAPIRQAESGAALDMIERTRDRFGLYPEKLVADTAYGSAETLGWLVESEGIEPHIPVIDKSQRRDGTFSREDFTYQRETDSYACPGGKQLLPSRRAFQTIRPAAKGDGSIRYRASKSDCHACTLKSQCCPKVPARNVTRSIHEGARDLARAITKSDAYVASSYARKKVEMLFAHLKRIIGLTRLRLRGPNGAKDEFLMAATVQNLRKLAMTLPNRREGRNQTQLGYIYTAPQQRLFQRHRGKADISCRCETKLVQTTKRAFNERRIRVPVLRCTGPVRARSGHG